MALLFSEPCLANQGSVCSRGVFEEGLSMTYRKLGLSVLALGALVAAFTAVPVGAATIPTISDAQLQAKFTEASGMAGAPTLNTGRTVPHWFGQTTNPDDGVTYGYNMVGADPNNCSGSACDVTVQADIVPVIVNVGGLTFDGNQVVASTLASPQFATNDYGSTPF